MDGKEFSQLATVENDPNAIGTTIVAEEEIVIDDQDLQARKDRKKALQRIPD